MTRFNLDGHPHLPGVWAAGVELGQHRELLGGGGRARIPRHCPRAHQLKALKLPTFLRDYASVAALCAHPSL